jgi:hypothetical protein
MQEEKLSHVFEYSVTRAAKTAGLPQLREPSVAFDDGDWVWEWREYQHNEDVAADVRLRVSPIEVPSQLRTVVSGLAWTVDPKYRYLSKVCYQSREDMNLANSWQQLSDDFIPRLGYRLEKAWDASRVAADEIWHLLVGARDTNSLVQNYASRRASLATGVIEEQPAKHGKKWTREDEAKLRNLVQENTPISLIAHELGRSEGAIYQHENKIKGTLRSNSESPYNRRKKG